MAYVYVIGAGDGLFKIGQTGGKVQDRLAALQTGCPTKLTVEHVIETIRPARLERDLHRQYADRREHGEWFRLMPEEVTELKERRLGISRAQARMMALHAYRAWVNQTNETRIGLERIPSPKDDSEHDLHVMRRRFLLWNTRARVYSLDLAELIRRIDGGWPI